jgi:PGF-CTERM protein
LTIRTVDATAGTITMDNKDNAVTLSKNKDVVLMPGISIQTADNDTLRFFIYKPVTVEGTNATTTTTTVQTTTTAPAENVTTTTVPTENATTTTTKTNAPAENVTTTTTKTTTAPAANNTTTTTKKTTPGFESVFALTGLLAVAYLVLSRRE